MCPRLELYHSLKNSLFIRLSEMLVYNIYNYTVNIGKHFKSAQFTLITFFGWKSDPAKFTIFLGIIDAINTAPNLSQLISRQTCFELLIRNLILISYRIYTIDFVLVSLYNPVFADFPGSISMFQNFTLRFRVYKSTIES